MTEYSNINLRGGSFSRRKVCIVFAVILLIAVAISVVIGFFIGKSSTEQPSKSPTQTAPKYLDASELETLRKKVNEDISRDRLREYFRLVNSFEMVKFQQIKQF